jgi:hypothetical protein
MLADRLLGVRSASLRAVLAWLALGFPEEWTLVSNYGRFDLPDCRGDLEVEALHVSSTPGQAMVRISAVTVRGELTCNFTYAAPLDGRGTTGNFSRSVMQTLRAASE